MLRGLSSFTLGNHFTTQAGSASAWWHPAGDAGAIWFISSGWQERTAKLYDLAAQVAAAMRK
jgi:hypothetical protein